MVDEQSKINKYYRFLYWWCIDDSRIQRIRDGFIAKNWRRIAVYGMGPIGEILIRDLRLVGIEVLYAIDRNPDGVFFSIDVYTPDVDHPQVDLLIVTPFLEFDQIRNNLGSGDCSNVIPVSELLLY